MRLSPQTCIMLVDTKHRALKAYTNLLPVNNLPFINTLYSTTILYITFLFKQLELNLILKQNYLN